MATTVNASFNAFLSNTVNLDPTVTENARSSRDWMLDQIHALPGNHDDFPLLYSDKDIHYGSFARRTKIRELDDIDLIAGVSARGGKYRDGNPIRIFVNPETRLGGLCYDESNELNSRKVINRFVKYLDEVPQYEKAEIGRNGSAVVLNLTSYPWSFDIVPGFFTTPEADGRTYYLIPDGSGRWMKTDPRLDQRRTTRINQKHDGNVLNVVRLVKYWNNRATMPGMPSYLLECIVMDYYEARAEVASRYVYREFGPVLGYVASAVLRQVQDPKNIQGDINDLPWDEKQRISERATEDKGRAEDAQRAERQGDQEKAVGIWQDIFGPDFPAYG